MSLSNVYLLFTWLSLVIGSLQLSFTIDYSNNVFLKDGKPFNYASSGIHYFRVPFNQWEDRLNKIRKSGVNAIQTYIAWNVHEERQGVYNFDNQSDIVQFIRLAQKSDLLVILRPGPYICAEWEYGGFPYWIMKSCQKTIRTLDSTYMTLVDKWFSVLLPKLKPFLYENGGPIILVQVENEYGSYGCDHNYMRTMEKLYRKYLGDHVILFTTDGAGDGYLKCGAIDSLYTTIDFGPGGDVEKTFQIQRKWQPRGPLVNSEYYTGWLDHWGEAHHTTDPLLVATYLDKMLALNASVNMYMFEGGTNFWFYNGANQGGSFAAQPTSYDYDAPLNEAGDPTEKYFAIQKVLSKYFPIPSGPQPEPLKKAAYGRFNFSQCITLEDMLIRNHVVSVNSSSPMSFEELDHPYGYVLYRRKESFNEGVLKLTKFHDRAIIRVDKVIIGVLDFNHNNSISVPSGILLDIIVENQGRVNYGPYMTDTAKGILSSVLLDNNVLLDWQMFTLATQPHELKLSAGGRMEHFIRQSSLNVTSAPVFCFFVFEVQEVQDTFIALNEWRKGYVEINDFNIGRYWTPLGPQKTLYVPKDVLVTGQNTVIVAEYEECPNALEKMYIEFVDKPILG